MAEVHRTSRLCLESRSVIQEDLEQRQFKAAEHTAFGGMQFFRAILTEDQAYGSFLEEAFPADRIRHNHRVNMAVADQTRKLLDIFAAEIQQNDGLGSLFHCISFQNLKSGKETNLYYRKYFVKK